MLRRWLNAALVGVLLAAFALSPQAIAADSTSKDAAKKRVVKKLDNAAKKKEAKRDAKKEDANEQILKRRKAELQTLERELDELKRNNGDPKKIKSLERRINIGRDDVAALAKKLKEQAAKKKAAASKSKRQVAPADQIEKAKLRSEAPRRRG